MRGGRAAARGAARAVLKAAPRGCQRQRAEWVRRRGHGRCQRRRGERAARQEGATAAAAAAAAAPAEPGGEVHQGELARGGEAGSGLCHHGVASASSSWAGGEVLLL